ncbi:MAG: LLM class flavin-dependent oxidoreductase, partial [Actinobacteria bacterium]|nr:LLM class flavin-dependent oxidoreductase [Actinomycetota bacterium]
PEAIAASVEAARALARERFGRELQIWTPAYVVQTDSDEEAARYVAHYGAANGDYEAADAFIEGMIETASNLPPEVLRALRLRIVEGGGGYPLVGTAATIAARMEALADCGLDGLLLSWIEYEPGIRRFAAEVSPLLVERGLRR